MKKTLFYLSILISFVIFILFFAYSVYFLNKKMPLFNLRFLYETKINLNEIKKFNIKGSYIVDNKNAMYLVYLPKKTKQKTKAIIICPGGGYQVLSYKNEGINVAKWLRNKGYAAIVLLYRMPEGNKEFLINDVEEMIKQTKENSDKWNIDKIGLMGFSAGGHIASFVSNTKKQELKTDFLILYYPVISMSEKYGHKYTRDKFFGENKSEWAKYSSENLISKKSTQTFISYSKDDNVVDSENSKMYCKLLRKSGGNCEIHEYKSGGHGWGWSKHFKYQKENKEYLLKWLKSF